MNRLCSIDFQNPSSLERTAVHEAAHALVATCASRMPRVLEVLLDPGGHSYCKLDSDAVQAALVATENDPKARSELLVQSIAVCSAGAFGEWIAFGSSQPLEWLTDTSTGSDAKGTLHCAEMIRELIAAEPRMKLRTALGGSRARAIDEALERRISGGFDLAEFWLRTRWGAVEHVAAKLLQCPLMPGDLVRTLIHAAPEKARPLLSSEQDIRLMSSAGAADSALGREMLRVLAAA